MLQFRGFVSSFMALSVYSWKEEVFQNDMLGIFPQLKQRAAKGFISLTCFVLTG